MPTIDAKNIPLIKLLVKNVEYCEEIFIVSVTNVPGGKSIKNDSILNIIKNVRKTTFTNIKSPIRILILLVIDF